MAQLRLRAIDRATSPHGLWTQRKSGSIDPQRVL
jgi:hypothetical protein